MKWQKFLEPTLQNYHDTWDKIESMLSKIMSKEFRFKYPDSFGGGWVYNWFCLDHVGYKRKILAIEILDTTMFMIGMLNS